MAKKKSRSVSSSKSISHYIIPGLIGGGIAWLFSGALGLGVVIVVAVILGVWMGDSIKKR